MAEVRWHINANGVAGRCKAQPGECPVSPDEPHYETAADARAGYEESMASSSVAEPTQRAPKPMAKAEKSTRTAARRRSSGGSVTSHGGHGSFDTRSAAHGGPRIPPMEIPPTPSPYNFGHGLSHGR